MTKASDTQVGGNHYKTMGEFQPWDVLKHWLTPDEYRGYQKGVAIAYLARERQKGGDQDIAKAAHHLQKLIEVLGEQDAHTVSDLATDLRSMGFTTSSRVHDDLACCGHPNTCENPCFHQILKD